jgi:hypothetical protein
MISAVASDVKIRGTACCGCGLLQAMIGKRAQKRHDPLGAALGGALESYPSFGPVVAGPSFGPVVAGPEWLDTPSRLHLNASPRVVLAVFRGNDACRGTHVNMARSIESGAHWSRSAGVDREGGAGDGTRTRDILLGKQTLYRLSYSRPFGPLAISAANASAAAIVSDRAARANRLSRGGHA